MHLVLPIIHHWFVECNVISQSIISHHISSILFCSRPLISLLFLLFLFCLLPLFTQLSSLFPPLSSLLLFSPPFIFPPPFLLRTTLPCPTLSPSPLSPPSLLFIFSPPSHPSSLPLLLSPALSHIIKFLRRAGRLEEVPVILAAAEEKDRRSGSHAGNLVY
jgi:hypothetical protein